MRAARLLLFLFLLTLLLATGCDSAGERGAGSFHADVRGTFATQLEGSAQFSLFTGDNDEPSSFEIRLFAENGPDGEIIVRSAEGSGAPKEATYDVQQTITGASTKVVRIEFTTGRFSSSPLTIYEGETGTLELTNVADDVVEGRFDFDAVDNSSGSRVFITGEFIAQKS